MVETSPKHIIIAAMISGLVLISVVYLMTQMDASNGAFSANSEMFANLTAKSNALNTSLTTTSGTFETNVTQAQTQTGVLGALNGLINTAWGGLKSMFGTFSFINDFMKYLFRGVLGLPTFFAALLWGVLIIIIAFSIWSAIFQKEF